RRSKTFKEPEGRYSIDPVLSVLERLWIAVATADRPALEGAVRAAPVFPIRVADNGRATRVATADVAAFYPTRSLKSDVPLRGLQFLAQELCWGQLTPPERTEALRDQMPVWQALFELREFKFPEVMRTSVLPALELERSAAGEDFYQALLSKEV